MQESQKALDAEFAHAAVEDKSPIRRHYLL